MGFVLQDDPARKTEMKLVVPEVLKQILVNDWENVTKENKVRLVFYNGIARAHLLILDYAHSL